MFKQLLFFSAVFFVICYANRPYPEDPKQALADLQAAGIDKKYAEKLVAIEHKVNEATAKANGNAEKLKKIQEKYKKSQLEWRKSCQRSSWRSGRSFWLKYPKKAVLELVAAGISKKVADVLVQGDNLYYKQLAAAKR
ncbi:Protein CBG26497 [Caenorhabditis briggsae]|uniref:Protein CBG26497 n=1 Tax=Caenorhabditis briggsae TaxID=6238 RepID=B6IH48_CAEBR|nr:Protein CBG26497 [Caenorhabditis briggsae]CAR99228.1 Protein CBG26497 [Caenorhabditis briggsae]